MELVERVAKIEATLDAVLPTLATKADLAELAHDTTRQIAELAHDTTQQIAELAHDTTQQIGEVKDSVNDIKLNMMEFKVDLAEFKADVHSILRDQTWKMIGAASALTAAAFAIAKFVH
jgi:ElaB/YqjD/DUF883 family membrane-anchored ribosome-binding protein